MDPNLLAPLVAGGLTFIGIVITALIWRAAKVRTVMWWLGFSLLPIAVYLLGLAPQVVGAYDTLVAWYRDLTVTPLVWVGAGLGALGVLLMLVSRVVPARPRKTADAAASGPAAVTRGGAPGPAAARPAAVQSAPQRTAASQPTPPDADLDEITEILRRRGIE